MDPEHRQELEENDLEVFLTNCKKWWGKHGTKVVLVLLVGALALFAKQMYDKRQAERHETMWSELANATSPEAARSLAMSYSEPGYKAKAWLKGADLLLARALEPQVAPSPANGEGASPPVDRAATLTQAADYYQGVLAVDQAAVVYRLNARLGLATVAETQGDFDAASKQYEQILADAGTEYAAISAQAKARLEMLPDLKNPVKFGPEPVAPVSQSLQGQLEQMIQDATPAGKGDAPTPPGLPTAPVPPGGITVPAPAPPAPPVE